MNDNRNLGKLFEGLIVILIVLVIIHTFTEEFATFMDYSLSIRKSLLIAGFGFDLIFTIEFLSRLLISSGKGRERVYMGEEGGFIDLVSSIPLLVFNSGPLVFIAFFSGEAGIVSFIGGLSFLKIVKAIRIARILRFFRTMKIFNKTKYMNKMTQKFLSRALTITISTIVIALIGFSFLDRNVIEPKSLEVQKILSYYMETEPYPSFKDILGKTESVLFIKKGEGILYQGISDRFFQKNYFLDDYLKRSMDEYEVYLDNKDAKRVHAFINMLSFSMIIGIIIVITTLLRGFFNKHISTVTVVMLKGFKNPDYLTPVRIEEGKEDLEIYQLANQYNRKWLPIKNRIIKIKKGQRKS